MNSANGASSYEKPIYYLKFSIKNAHVEVRLNDIPVLQTSASGVSQSEKPVPESILDGENTLSIYMSSLEDNVELSSSLRSADVSIVVRDRGAPSDQSDRLLHINLDVNDRTGPNLSESDQNLGRTPVVLSENQDNITVERSVYIDSPFPRWAWQDGKPIEENKENFTSLLEKYKEVYRVLKTENMSEIKNLYSEAAREFAAAYHYDDPEQGHRIINTGSFVGDEDWMLGDIFTLIENGFPLYLDVYADGRLARLVDENGDDAGIAYLNKNVEMVAFQKFGFYKNKNGQWIMIR